MKISKTANDAARAIVQHVEKETGKSLSLDTAMNICRVIQTAINDEATAVTCEPGLHTRAFAAAVISNLRAEQA